MYDMNIIILYPHHHSGLADNQTFFMKIDLAAIVYVRIKKSFRFIYVSQFEAECTLTYITLTYYTAEYINILLSIPRSHFQSINDIGTRVKQY